MAGGILGRFGGVVASVVPIPMYDLVRSHRGFEASDDVIDYVQVVWLCVRVRINLPLLVVIFVLVVLFTSFLDLVRAYHEGYSICADNVFSSVLHDEEDRWSYTYSTI